MRYLHFYDKIKRCPVNILKCAEKYFEIRRKTTGLGKHLVLVNLKVGHFGLFFLYIYEMSVSVEWSGV